MVENVIGVLQGPIPWLTTEQMVEVDRRMIEDFRIGAIVGVTGAPRPAHDFRRTRLWEDS